MTTSAQAAQLIAIAAALETEGPAAFDEADCVISNETLADWIVSRGQPKMDGDVAVFDERKSTLCNGPRGQFTDLKGKIIYVVEIEGAKTAAYIETY